MPSRPWYKWYPGDYAMDTVTLSLEEHGAYRALLDYLWVHGPFEPTETNLGAIWRVDRRKVRRIFARLRPYFDETSGLVDHTKLAKQRAQAAEKSRKARAAGKKGGEANAEATRARAQRTCAPDQMPEKDLTPGLPGSTPVGPPPAHARARDWTPEERAERDALQAELERRRAANGIGEPPGPRPVAEVVDIKPGNPEPGNPED